MISSAETYFERVDSLAGLQGRRHEITPKGVSHPVWVTSYRDLPKEGTTTAFSYGLSLAHHESWSESRPEVILCVNSLRVEWVMTLGRLVESARGRAAFHPGNIFDLGEPIAGDSEMSAFYVFAPSVVRPEEASFQGTQGRLHWVQLYPLYREEVELVRSRGPSAFFVRKEYDPYDVRRVNFGKENRTC